jgi:hypothetical protein
LLRPIILTRIDAQFVILRACEFFNFMALIEIKRGALRGLQKNRYRLR